jgi:hypothetical protein
MFLHANEDASYKDTKKKQVRDQSLDKDLIGDGRKDGGFTWG